MVIDFSISNFRSIRDKQTLSFEATNSTHLEEYFVMKVGKYRLLKIATLLGANASGKSNVLRAFYLFTDLMLRPCKDKTSEIEYDRFFLDEACQQHPSEMAVNFIVGEARYKYEIVFDNRIVYHEVLKCQPFDAVREHTVYERETNKETLVSTMKWGDRYRSTTSARILSGNLLHNRTLFGAYLNSNVDIPWMKDILNWMSEYFMPMVTTGDQKLQKYVSQSLMDNLIDKSELVRQLMKADIGISDLVVEQTKRPLNSNILDLLLHSDQIPESMKQELKSDPTQLEFDIHMSHNGHQGTVAMDYKQESGGTQRYYELSGLLLQIIKESHFLAIDELECRLHPDLYQHFVTTYLLNSHHSQLVFSSHLSEFLSDRDLFRDDSVWITKKSEQGDTELYSLADFDTDTLRNTTNRYNAYRAGKLGGIPHLGDTYVSFSHGEKKP